LKVITVIVQVGAVKIYVVDCRLLVRRSQYSPGWYLPPQKIRLAENRFLQAGKGAENTKEKIQAVLYGMRVASMLPVCSYSASRYRPQ
jgi:hypothetical protein